MKRNVSVLVEQEYDVVVIGGGIFGICTAWDAASRGLSVALIEQRDFSHATSANHFKLVHGGIRYLQHADLLRVRESSHERNVLLRIAPHLVQPLPFVLPTYGHGVKGKEIMAAGLLLYDLVTLDRNQGIVDPQRQIPRGELWSREECLRLFPQLPPQGLTGAAVFHEAQMYNPPRLSLSFLKSAISAGAQAANYVRAVDFLIDGDRVIGVKAWDRLSGNEFEIRGRFVVNAAGPWANELLTRALGATLQTRPAFSRDAYFVVKRPLVSETHALALQAATRDADALISRGHRHLFLIPWRDHTLVGVWHEAYQGSPDDYQITEEDLQQFLDEVNGAYPTLDLTLNDIATYYAGLILFGEHESKGADLSFGKRSLIIDHTEDYGIDGLITLIGVRYTTARGVAERVVDLLFKKWEKMGPASKTAETRLWGGDIDYFEGYLGKSLHCKPGNVSETVMATLVRNYGSVYQRVLNYLQEDEGWARTIGESNVLEAEVIHAVREEMALKLGDVVFRRTELGTGSYLGQAGLRRCAELMAAELSWSDQQAQQEVAEVEAAFPPVARRNAQPKQTSRLNVQVNY